MLFIALNQMSENTYLEQVPESICHAPRFSSVYWLRGSSWQNVEPFEEKVFLGPLENAVGEVVSLVGRACCNQVESFPRYPGAIPSGGT